MHLYHALVSRHCDASLCYFTRLIPAHRCAQLDENVQSLREEAQEQRAVQIKLEAQLTAAAQRLGAKHRIMAEVWWWRQCRM